MWQQVRFGGKSAGLVLEGKTQRLIYDGEENTAAASLQTEAPISRFHDSRRWKELMENLFTTFNLFSKDKDIASGETERDRERREGERWKANFETSVLHYHQKQTSLSLFTTMNQSRAASSSVCVNKCNLH